jgi:hypothetical protein
VRDFGCSSQGYHIEYDILGRCSSMVERSNRSWQMGRSIPSAGPTRSWLPNCLVDLTLPGVKLRELQLRQEMSGQFATAPCAQHRSRRQSERSQRPITISITGDPPLTPSAGARYTSSWANQRRLILRSAHFPRTVAYPIRSDLGSVGLEDISLAHASPTGKSNAPERLAYCTIASRNSGVQP